MQSQLNTKVFFVMGVSGSGKSTIGKSLANELGIVFIDADDHHPQNNIDKMSSGIPLTDMDRSPWLAILNQIAKDHIEKGCVIACSALKQKYRDQLTESISEKSRWIYLKGDYDLIYNRMKNREGHYMNPEMLKSQFNDLEEPKNVLVLDIENKTQIILKKIIKQLK